MDVVEAMEGGKSKALTEAHDYTVTSVLSTTAAYQRDGQMAKVDQATQTYQQALTCHPSARSNVTRRASSMGGTDMDRWRP